jgi:hypothetical protein
MKRVRGDELEAKAVDAEDSLVVVAVGSAKASPGTHTACRCTVTRLASDEPVVVAVVAARANQVKDIVVAAGVEEADEGKGIFDPKNNENYVDAIYDPFRGPRECDEFKEEASDEYSEVMLGSDALFSLVLFIGFAQPANRFDPPSCSSGILD